MAKPAYAPKLVQIIVNQQCYQGTVIFSSECTRNRLLAGLRRDPLNELTVLARLSNWIRRGAPGEGGGRREGKMEQGGRVEKEEMG